MDLMAGSSTSLSALRLPCEGSVRSGRRRGNRCPSEPGQRRGRVPIPKTPPWQGLAVPVRDRKRDDAVLGCGDHKKGLFGF